MTKEDKDILIKEISTRFLYGVVYMDVHADKKFINKWNVIGVDRMFGDEFSQVFITNCEETYGYKTSIENIKPYLFPLSAMTEEQNDSWRDTWFPDLMISTDVNYPESEKYLVSSHVKSLQWLYENHFDINGLIDKGLALDATDKNIY